MPEYTFEHEADLTDKLRNSWIIRRRFRPYVPVLEGVTPPSPSKPAEENAQYCSLFFRPWTLRDATQDIPHLARLGVPAPAAVQPPAAAQPSDEPIDIAKATSFKTSWQEYIRGNIVSEQAAALIRSFLTKTMARSTLFEAEDHDEADKSDIDDDVPPFVLSGGCARALLGETTADVDDPGAQLAPGQKRRRTRVKGDESRRLATQIWGGDKGAEPSLDLEEGGPMHEGEYKEHIA